MKNLFLLIVLFCNLGTVYSQSETEKATAQEIDKQVWQPFQAAYASYDAPKYIALHTDDVLRISKWSGIKNGSAFRESIQKSFAREIRPERQISFQFEHRLYTDDLAYEVGYYKSVRKEEGQKKASYGRFHVLLKKVAGQWKIAQDWDTGNVNGKQVTAADFARLVNNAGPDVKIDDTTLEAKYQDKVKTLDATIESLYSVISGEAGEERDWDLFRYLFQADAKLIPSGKNKAGKVGCRYLSPEEYIASSGKWLVDNGFFEKEINRKTETFGNITQVFSTYESFKSEADEAPFMRGINSIQLLNDGKRWWIINIYWTNETEETPLPSKYLK